MNRQPVATAPPHHYYTYHPLHQHYHDPALTSLVYRQVQLPVHQHQPAPVPEHSHQLSLAAASNGFHQPTNFRHHHPPLQLRQQTRQARAMDSYQQQGTTDEELTELQKLSNEYEPEVTVSFEFLWRLSMPLSCGTERWHMNMNGTDHHFHQGPLVGSRQPSTAITTEYASADPVLQAKTAVSRWRHARRWSCINECEQALPQKYSHYRTVRGDGRCGWRGGHSV